MEHSVVFELLQMFASVLRAGTTGGVGDTTRVEEWLMTWFERLNGGEVIGVVLFLFLLLSGVTPILDLVRFSPGVNTWLKILKIFHSMETRVVSSDKSAPQDDSPLLVTTIDTKTMNTTLPLL